jgi:hypothetical protein
MILRRLVAHLREQHWTGVFIELAIVVLGVFLGIQASNWNEQRATDQKAREFTERLRDDLRVEVWRFNAVNSYYADVQANARKTLDALEGRSTLSNEALLVAAYRATQYGEFAQYRSTYDELTATGNIGLVADLPLRKLATEIYSTKLYENVKNEGVNSRYRVAFRMLVPIAVQEAIARNCGDRSSEIGNYESIKSPLDYECSTGLPAQDIDGAASILRADATLVPLLRLRIADMNSAVSNQIMSQDVVARMQTRAGGKP